MTAPKSPQDHLKPAAQIEAEGIKTIAVEFKGLTLTFPADADDWSLEAEVALEDGLLGKAFRAQLGPVQWAAVLKTKPLKRDLMDLNVAVGKALGFESPGE